MVARKSFQVIYDFIGNYPRRILASVFSSMDYSGSHCIYYICALSYFSMVETVDGFVYDKITHSKILA